MNRDSNNYKKNQTWLHQKLKSLYSSKTGGKEEVEIQIKGKKYRLDVFDEEKNIVYEIQRSNFGGRFSEKIKSLLCVPEMRVIIVHPIVLNQKVTRMIQEKLVGVTYIKKCTDIYTLFENLVNFKMKFIHAKFGLDVLFIKEHLLKEFMGYWGNTNRKKYKVVQRDLMSVEKIMKFRKKSDFLKILPIGLPNVFTNRELAEKLFVQGGKKKKLRIPGRMTYSLCRLGVLERVGSKGRAHIFSIAK
ncbi:MAG: hypothetical protein ACXAC8_12045 [Candidatus Hodarchaeales archaeon]